MESTEFLTSLTDELLSDEDYLDVSGVGQRLTELTPAISALQKARTPKDLDRFFALDQSTDLTALLLGSFPAISESPGQLSRTVETHLLHWRRWTHGQALKSIVTGLLIAEAQKTRGRRRRRAFSETIANRLAVAVRELPFLLDLQSPYYLRSQLFSRKFDYVILADGTPTVAVVPILQTTSGGRQQDIFLGLPEIQDDLLEKGVTLLVVADGPGFRQMGGVVEKVAPRLRYLSNLKSLDRRFLTTLITKAIEERDLARASPTASYENLAASTELALRSGYTIHPALLGVSPERSASFILQFTARHPDIYARYEGGSSLSAERETQLRSLQELVADARLGAQVDLSILREYITEGTGFQSRHLQQQGQLLTFGLEVVGVQLRLPQPLPIFVVTPGAYPDREEMFSHVDGSLSRGPAAARTAVVVDLVRSAESRTIAVRYSKESKSQLAVLDEEHLAQILLLKPEAARRYFLHALTRDIDLSIVSPFVSEGPTTSTMFFGRESEIRRMVEQAGSQSFAIIGGRKTGKTSLLQRLRDAIPPRAHVSYVDCQAHPNREDFLAHILSLLTSPPDVSPGEVLPRAEAILRQFVNERFPKKPGVLLLDEVDELFLEDSEAHRYPHVLSKALRAIFQSSDATIVATGERSLFDLTTDPSSPHWNFCTPLKIGPLSPQASGHLISDPLQELGVDFEAYAIDFAIARTAMHPNLIQYLGTKLVEALTRARGSQERLIVDLPLVDAVTSSPDFRQRFVLTFFSQATPLEKLIGVTLSSDSPKTVEDIRGILHRQGLDPLAADIIRSLSFLDLYFISTETVSGYLFASTAFDFYLTPLASSLMIEQWRAELP